MSEIDFTIPIGLDGQPLDNLVTALKPTEVMKEFGIVAKYLQKPSDDDKKQPYWSSAHKYDSDVVNWGMTKIQLTKFEQSGLTHYFGVIELGLADAICRVPALPKSADSLEICRRTIDNEVTDQYQRPIDFDRVSNLNDFLQSNPTIVNPIILNIPENSLQEKSAFISENEKGEEILVINLQNIEFIKSKLQDIRSGKNIDFRPIEIVDGQHRVRSSGLDQESLSVTVPFVLISPHYEGGGGRVFAEINAQSEPIERLHQLHLRYVLSLSSHLENEDYGEVNDDFMLDSNLLTNADRVVMERRFANRTAYRVGAKLNINPESAIHKLIRFYGKKDDDKMFCSIDSFEWVKHCREWVLQDSELAKDEDNFVKVIQCYFEAWKRTANTDPLTGGLYSDISTNNRWGRGRPNKKEVWSKLLILKICFKSIMSLYPLCKKLTGIKGNENEKNITDAFFEVLRPCQPIDGQDINAWKHFMNSNNRSEIKEKHFYNWMAWAVLDYYKTGVLQNPSDAWNTSESSDIPSGPGKAFFSGVNPSLFRGTLEVKDIPNDPEEGLCGATIIVTADEMPNEAIPKNISFHYVDDKGIERQERRFGNNTKGPNNSIGFNFLSQKHGTGTKNNGITTFEIRITSGNTFVPTTDLYKQKFTIEELRNLNNKTLGLVAHVSEDDFDPKYGDYEKSEVGENKEFKQFIIPELDEVDDEVKFDEYDEEKSYDGLFSGPPPKNQSQYPKKSIQDRLIYRPPRINNCPQCFHGIHDSANCGFNIY